MNLMGIFPTRNFREGRFEEWKKISPEEFAKMKVRDTGCYACIVRCGKVYRVRTGPYAGISNEGPEYESLWAFTAPIDSADIGMTVAADALCDDLGMDTISAGNTIGFAYELFEKGILSLEDTDGLDLTYSNSDAALELLKRIGNRQGLGNILAEGTKRAALHIGKGAEYYAMQIKGMELPAYEPRGAKRHGLGYATSNIGGTHGMGYVFQEIFSMTRPRPVDRLADEGDTDLLKLSQDTLAMYEIGINCVFTQSMMPIKIFASMMASATGIPEFGSREYLFKVGERIYNLERAFNLREGFSRKDDAFPSRMTTEPLKNAGPAEGQIIRKPDVLIDEYYQARGWDENGIPASDKLKELGLEGIIKDIEEIRKRGH
jgi:aldehyde:ferredoxin oxidoreductase